MIKKMMVLKLLTSEDLSLFLEDLKLWEFAGVHKLQDLGLGRVEGLV